MKNVAVLFAAGIDGLRDRTASLLHAHDDCAARGEIFSGSTASRFGLEVAHADALLHRNELIAPDPSAPSA